ncbi:organic cation/carnitine transporter 2-like isoform X1 [Clytia hemisphaerica]|uniref:Major facilitator superfamily (MFS) profile domain-containing protein n=1 Tax=Clytia hemisphaerica TaxID=252671 RepID=A0A7M6DQ00_9CNID
MEADEHGEKRPLQKGTTPLSDVLAKLGDKGWYPVVFCLCICVLNSTVAFNHLIMASFGFTPPHSCKLPDGYTKNASIPMEMIKGKESYSQCKIYQDFNSTSGSTEGCPNGWNFILNGKESTIVNEWSLVCDQKYLVSLATTIYFTGVMIGGAVFGQLGDKFGRKPITLICLYSHIALAVGVYFSQSFEVFAALRFFVGFFLQGVQTNSYVLMAEMTSKKNLVLTVGFFEIFWAVGTLWLATLSWLIQDWRNIQLALCLPSLITLIYIWLFPESVLWLINKNKMEEAKENLMKISRITGKKLTAEDLDLIKPKVNESIQYSFHHLVKTPNIRKRTFLMCYLWLASSVGYYGLSLAVGGLAGDRYLNQFIGSVIELVAFSSVIFVLKYFRRRYPLMAYYITGGVTCIVAGVLKSQASKDGFRAATYLALIGKFGLSASFATIFLFTVEQFPTVVRTLGMGTCVFWARVGGMIAPQILLLGKYTFNELPYLIFGSLSLLAAMATYFLPETFGKTLPNTIDEIEGITVEENGTELRDRDHIET